MVSVNTPTRLLWMIVLAVIVPWLSVALTKGRSRELLILLALNIGLPAVLGTYIGVVSEPGEALQFPTWVMVVLNLTTFGSVVYAIRTLIKLHYNPEYLPPYEETAQDTPVELSHSARSPGSKV